MEKLTPPPSEQHQQNLSARVKKAHHYLRLAIENLKNQYFIMHQHLTILGDSKDTYDEAIISREEQGVAVEREKTDTMRQEIQTDALSLRQAREDLVSKYEALIVICRKFSEDIRQVGGESEALTEFDKCWKKFTSEESPEENFQIVKKLEGMADGIVKNLKPRPRRHWKRY